MKSSRYHIAIFSGFLLVLMPLLTACPPGNTSERSEIVLPNILLFTAEDISPDFGVYGLTYSKTPVLDSLASEGILFNYAFAPSGVCSPSRAAIVTGVYPTTLGAMHMRTEEFIDSAENVSGYEVVPPSDIRLFTEYLRARGYYCTNNYKTDYQFDSPFTAWDQNGKHAHWKNRPEGVPFFAVFNTLTTHASRIWEKKDDPFIVLPEEVEVPPYFPDNPVVREELARYHTNISLMDAELGERIDELREAGELENTVVIFTSDHGSSLLRGKRTVYNAGIQVPLIITFGGRLQDFSRNKVVSLIDLAPTILGLASVQVPEFMQGKDLFDSSWNRDYVFASKDRIHQNKDRVRAVRNRKFHYIRNYFPELPYMQANPYRDQSPLVKELYKQQDAGTLDSVQTLFLAASRPPEELYDMTKDPWQINNLASNPEYYNILMEFREALSEWETRTNDLGKVQESELVREFMPDGVQQTTEAPVIRKTKNQKIEIICPTEGASIGYRLSPDGDWKLYTRPLEQSETGELEVKAIRLGYKESPIVRYKKG